MFFGFWFHPEPKIQQTFMDLRPIWVSSLLSERLRFSTPTSTYSVWPIKYYAASDLSDLSSPLLSWALLVQHRNHRKPRIWSCAHSTRRLRARLSTLGWADRRVTRAQLRVFPALRREMALCLGAQCLQKSWPNHPAKQTKGAQKRGRGAYACVNQQTCSTILLSSLNILKT